MTNDHFSMANSESFESLKSPRGIELFKKLCSRGLTGNVFGGAPNTAGEDARATRNPEA
jgi:hypothetical protein